MLAGLEGVGAGLAVQFLFPPTMSVGISPDEVSENW